MSGSTSNHSLPTSAIFDDAEKQKVDNNDYSVRPETEVVGQSTGDIATSPSRAKTNGSLRSGTFVDVLSSTSAPAHHHALTCEDFGGWKMGNSGSKEKKAVTTDCNKAADCVEPNSGAKQVLAASTDRISQWSNDFRSLLGISSSNSADVTDVMVTNGADRAAPNDKPVNDVMLCGNSETAGVSDDVTIPESVGEADGKSESTLSHQLMDAENFTGSITELDETPQVGLDEVKKKTVASTENGTERNNSSADICAEIRVTETSEEDGKPGVQDTVTELSRLPNNDTSTSTGST